MAASVMARPIVMLPRPGRVRAVDFVAPREYAPMPALGRLFEMIAELVTYGTPVGRAAAGEALTMLAKTVEPEPEPKQPIWEIEDPSERLFESLRRAVEKGK